MTDLEKIQKQLDSKLPFVKMKAKYFCELAKAVNPNAESEDDVEVSMAKTLVAYDGKHNDTLNVNPKVAKRLLGGAVSPLKVASGKDSGKGSGKSGE